MILLCIYYDLLMNSPIIRVLVCFLSATHEGLTPFYCDFSQVVLFLMAFKERYAVIHWLPRLNFVGD